MIREMISVEIGEFSGESSGEVDHQYIYSRVVSGGYIEVWIGKDNV